MQPLCSDSITEPSSLLRAAPPLCLASVLRSLQGRRLDCSLNIETTGSHVPYQGLCSGRAISMPAAVWSVIRFHQTYPGVPLASSFDDIFLLSTPHQWFASARLLRTHLTHTCAFSLTLTTKAFYRCSSRWFGTYACTSIPRGLPSSLIQHFVQGSHLSAFVTH